MVRAGARLDGYIRVSRVGGRLGESFISPEAQREKIEAWAKLHDAQIIEWHQELDESGAKRERPKFQEALARCERGETGGIVVAKLDRFARSAVDALESIKRLEKTGARLVSVEDGFDDSTAMGRFARGILLLLAELEWERIRSNWETAIGRAVADGVHVTGLVPTGYKRNGKRSKLVPDPVAAPVVREAFRMRASRASCEKIARYFEEKGVTPPTGNPHWSRQGVRALLRNKVYIGQARGWKGKEGEQPMINDHAHEALVTTEEFEAAQDVKPYPYRHDGSIAAQVMLAGLIKCAGCGHNLTYSGTTNRDGRRTASYMCRGRYASGICPAPAAARAEIVDGFVREVVVLALVDGILDTSLDQVLRYDQARQAVANTQTDLDALANPDLLRTLGPERLAQMAEPLKAAYEAAREQLRETPKPGEAVVPSAKMWAYGWNEEEPIERQRQLCRQFIQRVELRRSGKRGKAAGPISARLSITWVGHDEPDTAIVERVAAAPKVEFIGDWSAHPRVRSSTNRTQLEVGTDGAGS
jgi:DNA invertase Pin-like site-specific DNA recombinase